MNFIGKKNASVWKELVTVIHARMRLLEIGRTLSDYNETSKPIIVEGNCISEKPQTQRSGKKGATRGSHSSIADDHALEGIETKKPAIVTIWREHGQEMSTWATGLKQKGSVQQNHANVLARLQNGGIEQPV